MKGQQLIVHRPNPGPCLCSWTKLYWKTTMAIHLLLISGYFQAPVAELSSCNKTMLSPQNLKHLLSDPIQNTFTSHWLRFMHCLPYLRRKKRPMRIRLKIGPLLKCHNQLSWDGELSGRPWQSKANSTARNTAHGESKPSSLFCGGRVVFLSKIKNLPLDRSVPEAMVSFSCLQWYIEREWSFTGSWISKIKDMVEFNMEMLICTINEIIILNQH